MIPGSRIPAFWLAAFLAAPASADLDATRHSFLFEINRERAVLERAPLRLSGELCRAAQDRAVALAAADSLETAVARGDELLRMAARAGYEASFIAQMVAQDTAGVSEVVAFWKRERESAWDAIASERYRDVGIGAVTRDGIPLYVLFFGVSSEEAFARNTAALKETARVRARLLEAVNRERHVRRLPPLGANGHLEAAAQGHADDMLRRAYYGHSSPERKTVYERAKASGYPLRSVGENIAKGQTSIEDVMDSWMHSDEHRKNILSSVYTEAGFGIAIGRMPEGPQVLWVQVFGRPQTSQRRRPVMPRL